MQHVEFFHKAHFDLHYHRTAPPAGLENFIDFIWETDFDDLWKQYPAGFSDALFPNVGYTYLINLGTPFVMQIDDRSFDMRSDGFLPRQRSIECYHQPGNKLFGIKFRLSPVLLQKRVNFAEYREYIFPLSYLADTSLINGIKLASSFEERVSVIGAYYLPIVEQLKDSQPEVSIVHDILDRAFQENNFADQVESLAALYNVSPRTLQRYFERTTGISCKQALQIMRIRKATAHLASNPESFHFSAYGYYDHSHFYKHLKQFLHKKTIENLRPHWHLLQGISRMNGI